MAVNLHIPDKKDIHPVKGVEIGISSAGIRTEGHRDITVFRLAPNSAVAGVFTTNRFRAAPVQVCEQHLHKEQDIRALVINTGSPVPALALPVLMTNARMSCSLCRYRSANSTYTKNKTSARWSLIRATPTLARASP